MTRLYYKRRFGAFECVRGEGEGRQLKIVLDEPISARISIGKRGAVLKNGEAELDLSTLDDGIYEPIILKRGGSEKLGAFLLSENGAQPKVLDFDEIELIRQRLWKIEGEIRRLDEAEKRLNEKIMGTSIF